MTPVVIPRRNTADKPGVYAGRTNHDSRARNARANRRSQ